MVGNKGVFEHLKEFPVVLVTGPQRSGTRIAAKMIACDTGHRFVDEREIHTDSLYELMQVIRYQRSGSVVVQCPAMMCLAHIIYELDRDVRFVVMLRDTHDILASQKRVNWGWEFLEQARYPKKFRTYCVAQTKYNYWEAVQDKLIPWEIAYWFQHYEDLSAHPLWIPKEERGDFDAWQTEVRDG